MYGAPTPADDGRRLVSGEALDLAAGWAAILPLAQSAKELGAKRSTDAAKRRFAQDLAALHDSCTHPLIRDLYLPLVADMACRPLVIGQMGQSVDGRIATETGHSHYINGPEGLDHLHRLRALVDAVIVGATTVTLDDPQLTTRRVPGPDPVRIVIDARARAPADRRVFRDGGRTLVIASAGKEDVGPHDRDRLGVETIWLPEKDGSFPPSAILHALRQRGLRTILVEGGGHTVSGFLSEGQIDRLHLTVAPLLIGSGPTSFRLPPIDTLDRALRFAMTVHRLGQDILLDCRLDRSGM